MTADSADTAGSKRLGGIGIVVASEDNGSGYSGPFVFKRLKR